MSTVDDVILGRTRAADVPTIRDIKRDPQAMEAVAAMHPPAPDNAQWSAQISQAYETGYRDCLERDRGPGMLGLVLIVVAAMGVGCGLGAWLF
jgi:hypothetical protein